MSHTHTPFRRHLVHVAAAAALGFLVLPGSASAQLTHAKDHRIVFSHLHVHPSSIDEHKKFWLDTLGGTMVKVGNMEAAKYLDGIIEWESPSFKTKPTGGTKSTTVDYISFTVPNLRVVLDRAKAAGNPIVTRAELPPALAAKEKDGVAFIPDQNSSVAFVMGPDDMFVELIEAKAQTAAIAMHRIHFAATQVPEMEAWYAKLLEAKPGKRGSVAESSIPGSRLTFSPAASPVVGTKGRVLDHIGFEVRDLEAYQKTLEAMGIKTQPYIKANLPSFGPVGIVYLTDPWGTYVELTEGLDKVQ